VQKVAICKPDAQRLRHRLIFVVASAEKLRARQGRCRPMQFGRGARKKKTAHLQLKTQRLVKADGGEFGRRVVDQFVDADQTGETGHGHNVAIVRVNHVREERLGSLKHKGKILHLKLSMRSWVI